MKKRILATIALTLALVMTLSSCAIIDFLFGEKIELTAAPLNAQVLVDFKNEVDPNVLFESDGWSNGDVFNVVWKKPMQTGRYAVEFALTDCGCETEKRSGHPDESVFHSVSGDIYLELEPIIKLLTIKAKSIQKEIERLKLKEEK